MNGMLVVMLSICLIRIQTENITFNPGDEYLYSILIGDTLTLRCPVNSSKKKDVRWAYMNGTMRTILSIGNKINKADFQFNVNFTNHVTYLRIYNITSKEQHVYKCYYPFVKEGTKIPFEYEYAIQIAINTCSDPTIWKPCCHKSTEKQETKKQRRAYSDHFTEVTLNQLHNGERILIIGQTNGMNASTESNI
ncbi:unnamed protein product [Mytilus coruscus]|uniref:Ig-like domain-containing protein n=1 Tax=Mytilus coruscus TaxID=42192 RepID=A0A6J8DT21_MYTCO|nr:unnamed protein product [Mytilus coruscus]